jgi:hypothetical protein
MDMPDHAIVADNQRSARLYGQFAGTLRSAPQGLCGQTEITVTGGFDRLLVHNPSLTTCPRVTA